MKNLNDMRKLFKTMKKSYYGSVALMTFMGVASTAQAMYVVEDLNDADAQATKIPMIHAKLASEDCKPDGTVGPIQNYSDPRKKIEEIIESRDPAIVECAKWAPLYNSKIEFDAEGHATQIVFEQVENKFVMGIAINKNINIALPLTTEHIEDGWKEHDDERLVSHKRYAVFVKKIFPDKTEETLKATEKTVLEPYKLRGQPRYLCVNSPSIENGFPNRQEFRIERTYERGDGSYYIKTDPNLTVLHLELEHNKFEHELHAKRSYQVVNCFGIDTEGKRHDGPQNYRLKLPFDHIEKLDPGTDDNNRNLRTYFDYSNAITLSRISSSEANIKNSICKRTGWQNDDANLKAYKIFKVEETNTTIPTVEEVNYRLTGENLSLIGAPDVVNSVGVCKITEHYERPDRTLYDHILPLQPFTPLTFKHVGFTHDIDGGFSKQLVDISVIYAGKPHILLVNYQVNSITYSHLPKMKPWSDNEVLHKSFRKAQIYFNKAGALDANNIPLHDTIVDPDKIIETEDHQSLVSLSEWLPGANWKVAHSGRKYR